VTVQPLEVVATGDPPKANFEMHSKGNTSRKFASVREMAGNMRWKRTCERRDPSARRETASGRPSPAQLTELRRCNHVLEPAVSRGVEPFAEPHVSGRFGTIEFPKGIDSKGVRPAS
jgi:hypothetical protein